MCVQRRMEGYGCRNGNFRPREDGMWTAKCMEGEGWSVVDQKGKVESTAGRWSRGVVEEGPGEEGGSEGASMEGGLM